MLIKIHKIFKKIDQIRKERLDVIIKYEEEFRKTGAKTIRKELMK